MDGAQLITVYPSKISGEIVAPASKSSMQRACAAAFVKKGISIIHNPGIANDDKASLAVIQTLGAIVTELENGSLKIDSSDISTKELVTIDFGESGLGSRMFTPIAALSASKVHITGHGSLTTRPMNFFDEVLPKLEVDIQSNEGKLPLDIQGPLVPHNITVDGSLSSQYLTGLLLSFAAAQANNVTIKVENLKSKPYIDLTLKVMEDFQLKLPENHNYESFTFGTESVISKDTIVYQVEGDWSGGAFLLVAAAVGGSSVIKGLDVQSTQADKAILNALQESGVQLSIGFDQIEITKPTSLKPFRFDATECPDLFPPLVALAANCQGDSMIEGVTRLAHKESDRGLTLQEEFGKMGIEVELKGDVMIVHGGTGIQSATTTSHNDHRIAMAIAVAALNANGPVAIQDPMAVKKSYPNFYEHIEKLGVKVV
ncbi:3-phosphoshikimate 1-carboxyvinyltransferase [Rhizosphaericola mali]|uniref:3-phosphoshikimate 1-carboxyvinyltransferase n=1 Tax=Rhizosphaericola mali TaxID=2545455 RepID=A0A5P2G1E6_9BACT|nr:3-phosphoshikimate 1-carboxyvinyltransferase [Rhizosphaericola mali]QES89255.1 3-phosphoshikimate 1-carboxyvinyltransferase [Rhizosphaericola mali]